MPNESLEWCKGDRADLPGDGHACDQGRLVRETHAQADRPVAMDDIEDAV